jgi:hypothetical protein
VVTTSPDEYEKDKPEHPWVNAQNRRAGKDKSAGDTHPDCEAEENGFEWSAPVGGDNVKEGSSYGSTKDEGCGTGHQVEQVANDQSGVCSVAIADTEEGGRGSQG